MECEIRFYYSKEEYNNKYVLLDGLKCLNNKGRFYEKTSQFEHPCKEFSFYSKEIDGRFRVRKTVSDDYSKCMLSWKRRLPITTVSKVNKEEEVELTIDIEEYDNLMYIIKNVIHMEEVESYERYRTVFSNDDVEIVLDEYPFGLALEIEAKAKNGNSEKIIDNYMKMLNLDYNSAYRLSWDDKYKELCKEQNKERWSHVLFDKDMPSIQ